MSALTLSDVALAIQAKQAAGGVDEPPWQWLHRRMKELLLHPGREADEGFTRLVVETYLREYVGMEGDLVLDEEEGPSILLMYMSTQLTFIAAAYHEDTRNIWMENWRSRRDVIHQFVKAPESLSGWSEEQKSTFWDHCTSANVLSLLLVPLLREELPEVEHVATVWQDETQRSWGWAVLMLSDLARTP